MGNISNYYISSKDKLISNKESYITGNKFRFTILSPRLIRLEYSESGVFEDRATSNVINRSFPKVNYNITESETLIQIDTGIFTLTYAKNKELKSSTFSSNIKAVINNSKVEWQMNNPEVKNLRTINYSIDSVKDKIILDKGLYSLDGFCVLDDSSSLVLDDNDNFIERLPGTKDIYLFMYGNDFEGCLSDYYTLTGYPSLIPRYALGAWWYKNDKYDLEGVKSIVEGFNNDNIPLSIFLLGNYWHNDDNKYLPCIDIKGISNYLNSKNIRLGVTINPRLEMVKGSYEYNYISKYISSDKFSFIPFTNDKVGIYINMFIHNLESLGVSTFSIDYNNPIDRITLWKFSHYHKGKSEMVGRRSIILSRNHGYAPHRYPIVFTGKTKINWYTFSLLPRYNMQGYNKGISFIASPVGGYTGGIEEDELYLRYVEFSCFSPIFLMASEGGEYFKRESYKLNSTIKNSVISYINLRYKLIPYLYSESNYYHETGHALIKPFYFDYPKTYDDPIYKNQYFFGRDFFVSPITTKTNMVTKRVMQKVFVPNGIWFDFLHGKQFNGGKYYSNFYREEDYPVFVKAGAIIPTSVNLKEDIMTSTEVLVYPLSNGEYTMYEDDGFSMNYTKGLYMKTKFTFAFEVDNYTFTISKVDGRNIVNNRTYYIRFKNTKNVKEVNISDNMVRYMGYYDKNDFIVKLDNVMVGRNITINIKGSNMLVSSVRLINEEIKEILYDIEISTDLKDKLDEILFSNLDVRKKRIKIRRLKRKGLEKKYIKIFINLLEYIQKI